MYPYVTLDISSKSHPYYAGNKTFDNEGSAARFQNVLVILLALSGVKMQVLNSLRSAKTAPS